MLDNQNFTKVNLINLRDPEIILSCAFRYALGRKTYIVGTVVNEIVNNWDAIHKETRKRLQKEIKEYKEKFGDLGMECDEKEWQKILDLPIV